MIVDTSTFSPGSPQALAIEHLFYFDLAIAALIFLTVAVLVIYVSARFRQRPGAGEPRQDEGNPKLELVWTIIPAVILAVLFVRTAQTMAVANPSAGKRRPNVAVIAHQWWWEYRYPASGVITANELHMPVGEDWLIEVRSADVIHDFWVPDLGAKVDAIPGHPNHTWIDARRTGTFLGTCAEFCGAEHALMGIRVIVQSVPAFDGWVKEQLQVPPPPTGAVAKRGFKLFSDRTCVNCHTIAGTKANGTVGPDLTHLADRETLGAGVLNNTEDNLTRWLENPQKYKPGCNMPILHLTQIEARDIAVYLEGLK
ncbi:MAG: cytochrome c oxidase subunit II [Candidatus Omnitrophica bacterium]|nr:cytochrome c oxidase subunit II [Candidatus Omnitrophota bacterium]